jgi:phosphoribosylformylglycinamidine cyclo-ligase
VTGQDDEPGEPTGGSASSGEPGRGEVAYRQSGVDLEAAIEAVAQIRQLAHSASRPEVVSSVGGFAGLVDLGDGRLLAAATDGVGTKLEVARMVGKLDTVGIDLVAMCANDVVCTGATPLFFLDYLAVGRLVPGEVSTIVSGVAEGCRRAGCALLGGETAEHPGSLDDGRFDLAGFCVGVVTRDHVLDPSRVQPGDALVGFPSSGLHANGFSLIREALLTEHRDLNEPVPALLGRTLAEELLTPTAIYVKPLLELAGEGLVIAAAHITGGGFKENIPRALPPGLGAVIDPATWSPPAIFSIVAEAARLDQRDLFGVLNMGIGMVVAVPAGEEDRALDLSRGAGIEAVSVGRVVEGTGVVFG